MIGDITDNVIWVIPKTAKSITVKFEEYDCPILLLNVGLKIPCTNAEWYEDGMEFGIKCNAYKECNKLHSFINKGVI